MDMMPVNVVIFGVIPESILMVWAGLVLVGMKPAMKKVVLVGILQGISVYFIRRFFDFGPHLLFQTLSLVIYVCWIVGGKWMKILFGVLLSISIVILIEGSITIFTGMNMAYVMTTDWVRILFLLPHELVLGFIIYMGRKKDLSVLDEVGIFSKILK